MEDLHIFYHYDNKYNYYRPYYDNNEKVKVVDINALKVRKQDIPNLIKHLEIIKETLNDN